jgi:hypothetical protein
LLTSRAPSRLSSLVAEEEFSFAEEELQFHPLPELAGSLVELPPVQAGLEAAELWLPDVQAQRLAHQTLGRADMLAAPRSPLVQAPVLRQGAPVVQMPDVREQPPEQPPAAREPPLRVPPQAPDLMREDSPAPQDSAAHHRISPAEAVAAQSSADAQAEPFWQPPDVVSPAAKEP